MSNKIIASDTNIKSLLKDQKFIIDYFQREYKWQEKQIKELIEDLTSTFLKSHSPENKRSDVEKYQNYYLGPAVFSKKDGKDSIIDGQQRITSITLFLIYLNNLQKKYKSSNEKYGFVDISNLIFSERYGEKSFNMSDEYRQKILQSIFETDSYIVSESDDDTIKNMYDRYEDIKGFFPDEIGEDVLPFFIDWLVENVKIVKITSDTDDNAYTIFETMNDRGLSLTQTEMLKGFVLSKISSSNRTLLDENWKKQMQKINSLNSSDYVFFQSYLRAKFAESIRQGGAGTQDEDFEIIGTRFNSWFKDNHREMCGLKNSRDFENFFSNELNFYVNVYEYLYNSLGTFSEKSKNIYYLSKWGIGESLQNALLMAPVKSTDTEVIWQSKMELVAKFIETFTVLRSVSYKKFGVSSIKHTMFNLIKELRDKSLEDVSTILKNEVSKIKSDEVNWEKIKDLRLHSQNKKFIKHLLCRITSFVDQQSGRSNTYDFYQNPTGKGFEIEHIIANKHDRFRDIFEQKEDFERFRNNIGGLILLPSGTNQSLSDSIYEDKVDKYLRENTFAQTLHSEFYVNNPNFLNNEILQQMKFESFDIFSKEESQKRNELIKRICESIWSEENFNI